MSTIRSARLPALTLDRLRAQAGVSSMSRWVARVLALYAGDRQAMCEMLIRSLRRLSVRPTCKEPVVQASFYVDSALVKGFGRTAWELEQKFNPTLVKAIDDSLGGVPDDVPEAPPQARTRTQEAFSSDLPLSPLWFRLPATTLGRLGGRTTSPDVSGRVSRILARYAGDRQGMCEMLARSLRKLASRPDPGRGEVALLVVMVNADPELVRLFTSTVVELGQRFSPTLVKGIEESLSEDSIEGQRLEKAEDR
ncbi:MAG: hypothetical protein LBD06_08460 [Candidatus Accumulibacter sp.]|jgi:hypothetical protein|nr:hypothetical protein [Accumulibacter sp.]